MRLLLSEMMLLIQLDKDMVAGTQPFVVDSRGEKWSLYKDVLKKYNLEAGQKISDGLLSQVLKGNLTNAQTKLAIENMKGNKDE